MTFYRMVGPTEFAAPAVIAAFDGWIDAASAATGAVGHLVRDAEVVATFDGDALFDYRSRRPVLDVVDGTLSELTWPEMTLQRFRAGERDVLVLGGPEPDYRWRELSGDIADLAVRLGVVEWVSLGAIPAAVAHTRPVPTLATASQVGLLRDDEQQGPEGLLRVPAAALSVIELAVSSSGIPAVGFYAQVPHYVAGPYPAAAIALLERVARHLSVSVALGQLPEQARAQRARLDELVASQPEAKEYLERLETLPSEERIPSGDEIASEFERFLRESGGNEPNPFEDR